jgi:hypothetical protein
VKEREMNEEKKLIVSPLNHDVTVDPDLITGQHIRYETYK